RRHREPGDADLAERHGEHEGLAERELRPRDDGALHARRRSERVHRARRARAGARADRLDESLEPRAWGLRLSLRREAPRPGLEADLRTHRLVHLARGLQALSRAPEARVVLRPEALVV